MFFRLGQRLLETRAVSLKVVLPQWQPNLGKLSIGAAGLIQEYPTAVIMTPKPHRRLPRESIRLP